MFESIQLISIECSPAHNLYGVLNDPPPPPTPTQQPHNPHHTHTHTHPNTHTHTHTHPTHTHTQTHIPADKTPRLVSNLQGLAPWPKCLAAAGRPYCPLPWVSV